MGKMKPLVLLMLVFWFGVVMGSINPIFKKHKEEAKVTRVYSLLEYSKRLCVYEGLPFSNYARHYTGSEDWEFVENLSHRTGAKLSVSIYCEEK